jgi:hypothetical protein
MLTRYWVEMGWGWNSTASFLFSLPLIPNVYVEFYRQLTTEHIWRLTQGSVSLHACRFGPCLFVSSEFSQFAIDWERIKGQKFWTFLLVIHSMPSPLLYPAPKRIVFPSSLLLTQIVLFL